MKTAHGSQTLLPGSKSAAVWAPGDEPAQHAATPVRAAASRSPRPKSATIEKPSALAPELRRDARDGIAPELVSDPFAAPPAPPEMPQGEDDPFAAPQPEMYPAADDPFADEPEKAPDELIDPFDPPDAFRS